MKSKEAMNELNKISIEIKSLLEKTNGTYGGELGEYGENIKYDDNPDEAMLRNEIYHILKNLDDMKREIEYLNKPIIYEGYLRKNHNGRYEIDEIEFTCGSSIEALIYDNCSEEQRWVCSRIEHGDKNYYIVGCRGVELDGLKVRVRR